MWRQERTGREVELATPNIRGENKLGEWFLHLGCQKLGEKIAEKIAEMEKEKTSEKYQCWKNLDLKQFGENTAEN